MADTFVYGKPAGEMLPTLIRPQEVVDGAEEHVWRWLRGGDSSDDIEEVGVLGDVGAEGFVEVGVELRGFALAEDAEDEGKVLGRTVAGDGARVVARHYLRISSEAAALVTMTG